MDANAGSPYNDHLLYGTVRGGGWSDRQDLVEVFQKLYDTTERSILGIYKGSRLLLVEYVFILEVDQLQNMNYILIHMM